MLAAQGDCIAGDNRRQNPDHCLALLLHHAGQEKLIARPICEI